MELYDDRNLWYDENIIDQEGKNGITRTTGEVEKNHQAEEFTGPIMGELNSAKPILEIIMARENEALLEPVLEKPTLKPYVDLTLSNREGLIPMPISQTKLTDFEVGPLPDQTKKMEEKGTNRGFLIGAEFLEILSHKTEVEQRFDERWLES